MSTKCDLCGSQNAIKIVDGRKVRFECADCIALALKLGKRAIRMLDEARRRAEDSR